jgi:hypothetical protein
MGNVGRGITRALAINPGGTVNRALGGNAGVAAVIGVAAAIAIPFAAPVVAGAIFGSTSLAALTASGALIGAAGGALSGSMTGNAGRGALIGGAGGAASGFIQGGGIDAIGGLFGGGMEGVQVVPAGTPYGPPNPAGYTGGGIYGPTLEPSYEFLAGSSGLSSGTGTVAATPAASYNPDAFGAAVQATPQVSGIGSAVAGPATIPAGSALPAGSNAPAASGSWGSRFLGGVTGAGTKMDLTTAEGAGRALSPIASPAGFAGVGQLAMTMFNKPPEGLTAQERSYLDETAALAGTNRDMFEQRVQAARRLLQSGQANPEQAYAQANIGVQRRFREAGLREEGDVRRGQIEGARLGTLAAATEQGRASQATVAGLAAMPGAAPMGPVALGLPVYRESERRQREYDQDISSGFGTLASAFSGRGRAGLFA